MDANITALLTAVIVGGFSIATMYFTNRHNQQQNDANLRFRLTETAFNARLQAFGELATAMQSVGSDFGRFYVHAAVAEKKDEAHNLTLDEEMADKPVDPGFLVPLRQSAKSCIDTYYKYRMFLTPEMDGIASGFIANYCEPYRDFGPDLYTYRDAYNDTKADDPYSPLDDLTTEMRKYIAAVEKGK